MPTEGHFIILYNQTFKLCLHLFLFCEGSWEEWGRAIPFANRLRDFSMTYLSIDNLSLRIPEKLNLCYSYKLDETKSPPEMYLRDLYLS